MHVISTMSRRDLSKNARRWRCSESEEDGEMRKISGKKGCEKMKVLWNEEDGDEMKGKKGCEKMKMLWKEDRDEMKEIGGKKGCEKMKVLWKEEDRDEMKKNLWEKRMREDEGALRTESEEERGEENRWEKGRAENVNIEDTLK
jgi:hypothetical protein